MLALLAAGCAQPNQKVGETTGAGASPQAAAEAIAKLAGDTPEQEAVELPVFKWGGVTMTNAESSRNSAYRRPTRPRHGMKTIANSFAAEPRRPHRPNLYESKGAQYLTEAAEDIALHGLDVNTALRQAKERIDKELETLERTKS